MFKPQYKQLINVDSSLWTCAKACLSLQHNHFVCVFSHRIFSLASEMWYQYGSILLSHTTLLATLLCLTSYEQCSTRLLKVLHKCCNTDMLRVLLICLHSPSGAARPWDRAYISVKPLAAMMLQNIMYVYRKQQILCGTKLTRFSQTFDKTRKFSLLISMARSNMYCNLTKPRQFSLHSAKNQWTAIVLYCGGFVVYGICLYNMYVRTYIYTYIRRPPLSEHPGTKSS